MNFKSQGAYKKWLAYGHIHGDFEKTPGNQPVSIKGKPKKVEHDDGGESMPTEKRITRWRKARRARMMGEK